jgi:hypothetical protein
VAAIVHPHPSLLEVIVVLLELSITLLVISQTPGEAMKKNHTTIKISFYSISATNAKAAAQ